MFPQTQVLARMWREEVTPLDPMSVLRAGAGGEGCLGGRRQRWGQDSDPALRLPDLYPQGWPQWLRGTPHLRGAEDPMAKTLPEALRSPGNWHLLCPIHNFAHSLTEEPVSTSWVSGETEACFSVSTWPTQRRPAG